MLAAATGWGLGLAVGPAILLGALVVAAGVLGRPHGSEASAHADPPQGHAETHDQLRSLIECVTEAVVLVNDDGAILLANPAAMRLFKFEVVATQGFGLQPVLEGELGERAAQAWAALARPGVGMEETRRRIEITGIEHRGRRLDLVAVPAKSTRTGELVGTALVILDKTREHELGRLKDEFLSNISHELCTPLTNICAYAELLMQIGPDDADQWPEFVKIVQSEGQHLSRLVDSVLEHVREGKGELRLERETVDMVALARTLKALFAEKARDKTIAIGVETDSDRVGACVDRARISQVLSNLLDNAIKFTPPNGCVRLTVAVTEGHVELAVADSGPGIRPELRELAFERFRQLEDFLTDKPGGTGLGLARCRLLVDAHGGLIWCEDSPLGGACFRILLPVEAREPVA